MLLKLLSLFLGLSVFCLQLTAQPIREDGEPEAATGYQQKHAVVANKYMLSAANPYAARAGEQVLSRGGSAIDAAIAVQAMLALVEPQSSGLGGGAFILYWDNKNKVLHTFDGREVAPGKATSKLFMQQGKPMQWRDAVVGGRSVGVPGVLKALQLAHGEFGKLAWSSLFTDAINQAKNGFVVSPRLEKLVGLNLHPGLKKFASTYAYFYPNGVAIKHGDVLKNPALSSVLAKVAEHGVEVFYQGELAEKIVQTVQNSTVNPGLLSVEDLQRYRAIERDPVCGTYKQYRICGMPPPSSGGINVLQILKLLEGKKLEQYRPDSYQANHLFTQASRLTYADRSVYIADTDFTNLPFQPLIEDSYLNRRAKAISIDKDMGTTEAGLPYANLLVGADTALELPNTSHMSIIDSEGNAVAMTTSIEFAFGSGLMVEGFLLNNQLTDFSLDPSLNGRPALNRVEPYKRPRSAMSPTMVFDQDGKLLLVIGSPGGSRIISYVAQTIIGVLDWDLDIQQAINLPKITNRNDFTALEKGTPAEHLREPLEKLGHKVRVIDLNSGLHGIMRKNGKLIGGADPRREGIAIGQ